MKTPYPLILASTSKYRAELMSKLGWDFTCESPGVDEDQFKSLKLSPSELAMKLAQLKAQAVAKKFPQSTVIGSDQVCSLGPEILGKPGTVDKALEQLLKMSGKTHELITAVCILSPAGEKTILSSTKLHMRPLTKEQLSQYIEADLPLDCAGSYKLESFGIKLFHKIEMDDHTSIIGLPLIQLTNDLLALGYQL